MGCAKPWSWILLAKRTEEEPSGSIQKEMVKIEISGKLLQT
jgi:hypothetical protein